LIFGNCILPQYQNSRSVHGPEPYYVLVHGFGALVLLVIGYSLDQLG